MMITAEEVRIYQEERRQFIENIENLIIEKLSNNPDANKISIKIDNDPTSVRMKTRMILDAGYTIGIKDISKCRVKISIIW